MAWRLRLPAILFLLLIGIVVGPVLGVIKPDEFLGDLLFPIVSLCVALILFEGSLTLKFEQLKETGPVVRKLVTVGALVTWGVISLACYWLIGLDVALSALFGALVVVTGPTVVVPMLRTLRATPRISKVLRWEGILIDPIGALLAVLVYEWIVSQAAGHNGFMASLLIFVEVIGVGAIAGILGGFLMATAMRRRWVPEYLEVLASLALVLVMFSVSNEIAHESGLLTVTIMGIWLANAKGIDIEEILVFKEHLSVLLISGLFILLAARLDLDALLALGLPALALLAVIQFVARPLAVWISSIGSELSWQERAMVAWVGPRGIVAAAVSALFALRLEQSGYEDAALVSALTFAVIIGTVVFQSATARSIAGLLKVTEPERRGILLIGANQVSRALGEVLQRLEVPLLVVDTHWDSVRQARMKGLRTLRGNPLSATVDSNLDLAGLGTLLTLTPEREWNALLNQHFRRDFPAHRIFTVRNERAGTNERMQISSKHEGLPFGEEGLTFGKLSSLISQGARFKATTLSEGFSYEKWQEDAGKNRIALLALTPERRLRVLSPGLELVPEAGWTLIYLATAQDEKAADVVAVAKREQERSEQEVKPQLPDAQ
ncbi:sodium:proton antiporter [Pseudomonas neustonica]|uniref:Sodium:proton antiporter n=2 Tax=Pseudomonas TaxID=286 RepID=A0ABX9XJH8_9PSED|nr:sodium:proton antiporter [Pseudomonadales bacterium]MBA6420657.1 sodium:proton antiporter [Pseudomonas sp. 5Ae-yellow]ROZ83974.1 sodium:proton antiporter [Pseudomonas sp. SSM44]ROZ85943.1 sodium:proton antiporter [Pseudomonas neustonica]